jgi:hypothetical protein
MVGLMREKVSIFCLVLFYHHCFPADAVTGMANQVLDIAGSVKSIFSDPPQIDVDTYLNSEEQFRRAKSNFNGFLDKFSPKNSAITRESFTKKGKFLFFNVTKKNREEENLFNDMVDKVLEAFPLVKINVSAYEKTINGLIKAIEDGLSFIRKKERVFLVETIITDFYEDFMSFFYNFEREKSIVNSLTKQKKKEQNVLLDKENALMNVEAKYATVKSIDQLTSLLGLYDYLDEQVNYFFTKSSKQSQEIEKVRNKVGNSITNMEQVVTLPVGASAVVYKYLFNQNGLSKDERKFFDRMNFLLKNKFK